MRATDRFTSPASRGAGVLAGLLLAGVACLAQAPAPGRVLVSDVLIQGNRLVPTEQVRSLLKTRPGSEYVPEVVQEDVRALYTSRQFVNAYANKEDDGPDRVKVIFHVRDYPNRVEKVTYLGRHAISQDDLDALTNVRKDAPLNPIANKGACRNIVRKYNEEGYPFAGCVLVKGGDPNDTEVVFQITEGPKVKVRDIAFTGNTFVRSEVLRTHINTSRKVLFLGGTFNPALVDADTNELMKYYRSFGYLDVRVGRELQYTPDGREVTVTFHIQEGVRYRVKDRPSVHGVRCMPHEQLEVLSKVQPGEFYSQATLDADVARIKDYLGHEGRKVEAKVVPVYSTEAPGVVTVNFEIEETAPKRVGQIIIVGNERTKMNVIVRQIPLYPGQLLSFPELRVAERNLARLNIFETSPDGAVRPMVKAIDNDRFPDSPVKDILVTVQEANTGSLLFGIGVNSDSGLTGSIVLNERNFDIFNVPTSLEDFLNGSAWRGAGQEFRAEAVPGTQLQRYTVSFREPFLFDSPYSLTVSGYYYQRYFNEYNEERFGGRVTLGRKLNQYWSASVGARLENVNVSNVSPAAPPDYQSVIGDNFLAGFQAGVTRDSRDNFMRPTSGSLLSLTFEEVTGTQTYPLINLDASKYFTTFQRADGSGKQVLAVHSQVGWAGSNTPVFERYFAGGFRSIRGFQFRGVGPEVNGFKTGGDFLLLNSLEYQIPVRAKDDVYVVGFVDSGTVNPRIDKWDDYRVSAGFGIRFVVPMLGPVPIALDFGFPIVKGPHDNEQIFNFWMGFFR
jgi:outer membrane protein assembly complex protein YaeT